MDVNKHCSKERLKKQIEEWRAKRIEKMASRLQLHSDKPRTISSNVFGCGNYKKNPVQFDSRDNHTETKWNSNWNFSGYREYNPSHVKCQQDHRNNQQKGQSSLHSSREKRVHFSSHKSLYKKESNTNHHKKYSSCTNITGLGKEENNEPLSRNPVHPSCESLARVPPLEADPIVTLTNIDAGVSSTSSSWMGPSHSTDVHDNQSLESNIAKEVLDNSEISSCGNHTFTITLEEESFGEKSGDPYLNTEAVEDSVTCSLSNAVACASSSVNTVTDKRTCDSSIIVMDDDSHYAKQNAEFVDEKCITQLNNEVLSDVIVEPRVEMVSGFGDPECSVAGLENVGEETVIEPVGNIDDESSEVAIEKERNSINLTPRVDDIHESVSLTDPSSDDAIDNEIEFSLSLEPEIEVIEEDSSFVLCEDYTVPEYTWEAAFNSVTPLKTVEEKVIQQNYETPGNENTDGAVSLIVTCNEDDEASNNGDINQEIEHVENKLANISITHKDNTTPMKRERKNALLDATNILSSSTIMYSVREIKKNDESESEIVVTPVRRSVRLSVLKPNCKENVVRDLNELSPDLNNKAKFIPNHALYPLD